MKLLVFFIFILFVSCSTTRINQNEYKDVLIKAETLINKKDFTKAKEILNIAIKTRMPEQSPFVIGNTLIYYGETYSHKLFSMISAAAFNMYKNNDSVRNDPGYYEDDFELYDRTPWKQAVVIPPNYPKLHLYLGIISINEGEIEEAKKYFKSVVFMWDGFSSGWVKLAYCYIKQNNYDEANKIIEEALSITNVLKGNEDQLAILKEMKLIDSTEKSLYYAEEIYNKSRNLDLKKRIE